MSKISDSLFILFQYISPKRLISRLAGVLADQQLGSFTTFVINRFVKHYGVDLSYAVKEKTSDYDTFNNFFTRELKPESRPVDQQEKSIVFPADGAISQFGTIANGRIIQAKGYDYSLNTLLGGDRSVSDPLQNGQFITIYLSPKDYHRVHIPVDGKLIQTVFIPGALYSVNPLTASSIEGLFTKNERLVCMFETAVGPMAVVLVGATIVGSIETVWGGTIREKQVVVTNYKDQNLVFKKGDEIGRFKLGSTVICCFAPNQIAFNENMLPCEITQMGCQMGTML